MITLSEAMRLCVSAKYTGAYLRPINESGPFARVWLSDKAIRNHLDMKKVKVVRIDPHIDMSDGEFMGMVFDVVGVTLPELQKLQFKI